MKELLQSTGSFGLGYRVVGGTTGNIQAAKREGTREKDIAQPRAYQGPPSCEAKEEGPLGLEAVR